MDTLRGTVHLTVGERTMPLRLTLGALAAIEAGLGVSSLAAMEGRLSAPTARDFAVILAALIEGGGQPMGADDIVRLPIDIAEAVKAVGAAFRAAGLAGP